MRVLWLVSVTMPDAAKGFGVTQGIGGGWLQGQLEGLRHKCSLTVVAVNPSVKQILQGIYNGVEYILLPHGNEDEFIAVLGRVQPALVHIWGSEYAAAGTLFSLCDADHTLVSVQGVMTACAEHLNDGLPEALLRSSGWQRFCNGLVPGHLPDAMQAEFDTAAAAEQALLAGVKHVTGRTAWDKAQMKVLAPHVAYYACGEVLRPEFYPLQGQWQPHEFGSAPTLFLSAGNYPLKGLHRLIAALPAVKKAYPDFTLKIAGWKPVDKGPALRWLTDAIFPYEKWCRETAAALGVWKNIQYTGPLSAEEMAAAYLSADCCLLCSSVENSPNSLGEAMLLGAPCVASRVGGVPSMAQDGETALLYPAANSDTLAEQILRILSDRALARSLGKAAAKAAAESYAPENRERLFEIYGEIMDAAQPLDYKGGLT